MREIPKMPGWPLFSPHPKAPYFGEYSDMRALPYINTNGDWVVPA
jgi:hypothetical protein